MNAMPKHVVNSALTELTWNATRLTGDLPTAIKDLKQTEGGPVLVAGCTSLVRFLLAHDLVDELRLMVFPIAIGGGLTFWPQDRDKIELELTELVRYDSGVLL